MQLLTVNGTHVLEETWYSLEKNGRNAYSFILINKTLIKSAVFVVNKRALIKHAQPFLRIILEFFYSVIFRLFLSIWTRRVYNVLWAQRKETTREGGCLGEFVRYYVLAIITNYWREQQDKDDGTTRFALSSSIHFRYSCLRFRKANKIAVALSWGMQHVANRVSTSPPVSFNHVTHRLEW